MTNSYNMQDNEKAQTILNWPSREGQQFMQTFNDEKKEKYKTSMGIFGSAVKI